MTMDLRVAPYQLLASTPVYLAGPVVTEDWLRYDTGRLDRVLRDRREHPTTTAMARSATVASTTATAPATSATRTPTP